MMPATLTSILGDGFS